MGTKTPQQYAQRAEAGATLPPGDGDRLAGYALMGLPFSSGHYLAYRRFPRSSFGPGYSSVWLRRPDGSWSFYADAAPELSCARFFGAALHEAVRTPVTGRWTGPNRLLVSVPGVLDWELEMKSTPATMLLSALAGAMPPSLWSSEPLLGAMGRVMGPVLRSGRMGLSGLVPNGQSFRARPLRVWLVAASSATIDGADAGTPRPLPVQEHLADAWLPQRGVFVADTSLVFPSTAAPPP
ncbi:hypothetical protein GCM10009715_37120 [Paeniglutamicibacter psychrophenolicus]|uniref:RES domain-containing protein n=1 Tax=Paeniglutamicibacter psychrophenolicus TaxID=257454 RepID=A0ABS4W7Z6_9MICC|nr:hypothetical protein [Paeniglutamicibacter psychrophenolicus]MBP2372316.1 hypothetical protein [Paeniglutamicibacter psychrophenolicus]